MIWIIIGIILLILIIVLFSPVRIYISYCEKKTSVVLKYLFIKRILVGGEKKPKKAKKKSRKKTQEKANTDEKSVKKKSRLIPESFSGKIGFIKNIASTGGRAFRRITKHIKIKDIFIDIQVSSPDACECAVNFGKVNILVYNAISYLGYFVNLKKKSINIKCVYNQPESAYNVSFNIRLTPVAAIMTAIAFIFRFLVNNIKMKKEHQECQTA